MRRTEVNIGKLLVKFFTCRKAFTRFIEDIVDDTKDFVDDDESDTVGASSLSALESALAELTAKVNQLAELQLASAA